MNSANDEDEIASLLPDDSSSTSPSLSIESTSDTFSIEKPCMKSKHEISVMDASRIHTSDTPRRRFLKRGIQALKSELAIKNMKINLRVLAWAAFTPLYLKKRAKPNCIRSAMLDDYVFYNYLSVH